MISVAHAAFAVAAWAYLARGLAGGSLAQHAPDPRVASAFALAVLIASAAGSAAAIVAGRSTWSPARALVFDAVSLAAAAWAFAVVSLGPWSRDLGGVFAVAIVVMRLAPGALAVVSGRAPSWLAFVVALGGYGAMAAWIPVASLPLGDQIHYLLVSDRLAHGSLDATIDPDLFVRILGIPPSPADAGTHVALAPAGPRPVQGYALPLLLLPGWILAGRLGAVLIVALVAAWTSYQMFLVLRDARGAGEAGGGEGAGGAEPPRPPDPGEAGWSRTVRDKGAPPIPYQLGTDPCRSDTDDGSDHLRSPRVMGWTWLIASACAPMSLLATHIYPNAFGAALMATAFRAGFSAPVRRPALAAGLLALTLFLTPRDAVPALVLLLFLLRGDLSLAQGDRPPARAAIAALAVLALAVASNAVLYGIPLPYAGYLIGTAQAQELTREGSITLAVWLTAPAMLFDRTFGVAGSAPWMFIGLLGLAPALRADRARALPAALAVGVSVAALAFFRLWEGGYAPPARYFVDVLPLWAPFVAYGLVVAASARADGSGGARHLGATWGGGAPHLGATWGGGAPHLGATWGGRALRALAGALIGMSAITSFVLSAAPSLALNTAFDDKIRDALGHVLGLDPLAWLPSFQPLTPTWYVIAYLALLPALAIALALTWMGKRWRSAP